MITLKGTQNIKTKNEAGNYNGSVAPEDLAMTTPVPPSEHTPGE
jgi:hypothetical protein